MTRFPFPIPDYIAEEVTLFDDGVNAKLPPIVAGMERYSAVRGGGGTYSVQPPQLKSPSGAKQLRATESDRNDQIDTVRHAALIRNGRVEVLQNETAGFSVLVRLNAAGVLGPSQVEEVFAAIQNALRQDYGGALVCDLMDARTYWEQPGVGEHLLTIRVLTRSNPDLFASPQFDKHNHPGGQG